MQTIVAVSDVPVIVLSAFDRADVLARAFELGAADYMLKPFSPTELEARVRACAAPGTGVPAENARRVLRAGTTWSSATLSAGWRSGGARCS